MSADKGAGRDGELKLMKVFRSLDADDRRTLFAFAEFLAGREGGHPEEEQSILEPKSFPRPKKESVVAAIKRLSKAYYMLDRSAMLNETSSLMASHVINGRPPEPVIDELEALFARYYAKYREDKEQPHA